MAENQESHGPVLNTVNKRLRALRKKLNRVHHTEELLLLGNSLNKEQEEALSSKESLLGAINELEKIIQPLTSAVEEEEIQLSKAYHLMTEDLIRLFYFGILFDKPSQTDCSTMVALREHERNRCLLYDHINDDAADILDSTDLNQIATLVRMILSRPLVSRLSHQNALKQGFEQARLWLYNANQPTGYDPSVTYAGLRQKLEKIMASEYFTKTPEMKAPLEFQSGSFQVPSQGIVEPVNVSEQVEAPPQDQFEQKEETEAVKTQGIDNFDHLSTALDEIYQGDEGDKYTEKHVDTKKSEIEKGLEYISEASSQYSRGGRGGGSRGGRRGFSNGRRGSRGGRGGYFNGRNQYFEQGDVYYPRNSYYRGRGGRGGGGGGGGHNYQVGEGGYLVAN